MFVEPDGQTKLDQAFFVEIGACIQSVSLDQVRTRTVG
jgi:hypothetical protein